MRTENGRSSIAIKGQSRAAGDGPGPAQACIPGGMTPGQPLTWNDILPGGYDPQARLAVLDKEGIDQALMFRSIYLLWGVSW